MAEAPMLKVQVCFALPDRAVVTDLVLPAGATLQQAVNASGLRQQYPDIDLTLQKAGIFGKVRPADTLLRDGDRVEIYRPLQADPMETRRRRAKHKAVVESR
jgi:putative ubiquitin-RnfH superfamily antitoxin RatB of RatAB toxin-antitoxin module